MLILLICILLYWFNFVGIPIIINNSMYFLHSKEGFEVVDTWFNILFHQIAYHNELGI